MKEFVLAYILFCSFTGIAQKRILLEVKDQHTHLPVQNAHVSWYNGTDTIYHSTDANGQVNITEYSGKRVLVTHIAYLPQLNSIKPSSAKKTIFLEPKQEALEEVVVTGYASPVMANKSIRQVKVIGRDRIEQQAAVNLRDLLTNDLNFRISEDAILGSQISLQGLSGAKIKVLIDGVPVIGRLDGNIDLSQINLNDIERVEIVEGPMSVQYGTDAVAGTINLITKRKATSKGEYQVNSYYESAGRYNFDGTVDFPMGEYKAHISLGRNFFGGYDPNESSRSQLWNPKEQYFSSIGLQKRFEKIMLRYRGDLFDEEIRNLGEIQRITVQQDTNNISQAYALDDYYYTRRINNSLYADYYITDSLKLKVFAAHNYFRRIKNTLNKNLTTGNELVVADDDLQDTTVFHTYSSRLFLNHNWKKYLSYQVGYDFSYEENTGQRIAGDFKSITDAAVFATVDYLPVKSLTIQPGLRYAYNSRFEAPLIGSLAMRYQIDSNWIARLSYGQGFRAPSLKELYFLFVDENHNILGNQDLVAETSHNYQLSFSFRKRFASFALEAKASGFFNDIENEIRLVTVIDPDDSDPRGLFRNENIAQTQTTGGSLSTTIIYKEWKLETGATFIGLKNSLAFEDVANTANLDGFNFYPQARFNLSYYFKKMGLRPSLFVNYTGARTDLVQNTDGELLQTTFEPYTIADFTLQKHFWKKKISLDAGLKNIFNVTNIQANSTSAGGTHSSGNRSVLFSYGRTWFTRLRLNF